MVRVTVSKDVQSIVVILWGDKFFLLFSVQSAEFGTFEHKMSNQLNRWMFKHEKGTPYR